MPWPLVTPAALGLAFLALPPIGLVLRAPWSTLGARLAEPQVLAALRLSLVTATLATGLCLLLVHLDAGRHHIFNMQPP